MQKQGLTRLILCTAAFFAVSTALFAGNEPQTVYKLGPEDVVTVAVNKHPEFSGDFLVPSDGKINLPAVGYTEVDGLTIEELSSLISTKLKDRLLSPEVTVSLKTARMQRVYVLGVVKEPGTYDLKPGWRITEALAAAGGLSTGIEPSDCKVTVLSVGGKKQSVDFSSAISGKVESNLEIGSGDVLTIESEETIPVYIVGKVKTPGLYRLRKSSPGVMEALTLAGGTLDEAAISRVSVTHISGTSETVNLTPAIIEGTQSANVKLQSGDLVTVPETTSRIAVLGYIKTPGFYPLRDGQKVMLADALGLAGGVDNNRGGISSVVVVRSKEGKQEKLTYNLNKFLKSGDITQNPVIQAGDVIFVPETGKPDWELVFRAISSVGVIINPFIK